MSQWITKNKLFEIVFANVHKYNTAEALQNYFSNRKLPDAIFFTICCCFVSARLEQTN